MMALQQLVKWKLPLALVCATFGIGYSVGGTALTSWSVNERRVPAPSDDTTREVTFVYIGSSLCAPSNNPRLPARISEALAHLRRQASNARMAFLAVGVARDRDASEGIRHLASVGAFDVLATGRGSANTGLVHYVYNTLPGPAITPQIVVTVRDVDPNTAGRPASNERVLLRKAGVREILDWTASGMPVEITPSTR